MKQMVAVGKITAGRMSLMVKDVGLIYYNFRSGEYEFPESVLDDADKNRIIAALGISA